MTTARPESLGLYSTYSLRTSRRYVLLFQASSFSTDPSFSGSTRFSNRSTSARRHVWVLPEHRPIAVAGSFPEKGCCSSLRPGLPLPSSPLPPPIFPSVCLETILGKQHHHIQREDGRILLMHVGCKNIFLCKQSSRNCANDVANIIINLPSSFAAFCCGCHR